MNFYEWIFFFSVNLKSKLLNNNDAILYKLVKLTAKNNNPYIYLDDLLNLKIDIELLYNRNILEHLNSLGYINYDFDYLSSSNAFDHLTVEISALDYPRKEVLPTIKSTWALLVAVIALVKSFFF